MSLFLPRRLLYDYSFILLLKLIMILSKMIFPYNDRAADIAGTGSDADAVSPVPGFNSLSIPDNL
jgi:hypothetical protein